MSSYNLSLFGSTVSQTVHFETQFHDFHIISYVRHNPSQDSRCRRTQHSGSAEVSEEIPIRVGRKSSFLTRPIRKGALKSERDRRSVRSGSRTPSLRVFALFCSLVDRFLTSHCACVCVCVCVCVFYNLI